MLLQGGQLVEDTPENRAKYPSARQVEVDETGRVVFQGPQFRGPTVTAPQNIQSQPKLDITEREPIDYLAKPMFETGMASIGTALGAAFGGPAGALGGGVAGAGFGNLLGTSLQRKDPRTYGQAPENAAEDAAWAMGSEAVLGHAVPAAVKRAFSFALGKFLKSPTEPIREKFTRKAFEGTFGPTQADAPYPMIEKPFAGPAEATLYDYGTDLNMHPQRVRPIPGKPAVYGYGRDPNTGRYSSNVLLKPAQPPSTIPNPADPVGQWNKHFASRRSAQDLIDQLGNTPQNMAHLKGAYLNHLWLSKKGSTTTPNNVINFGAVLETLKNSSNNAAGALFNESERRALIDFFNDAHKVISDKPEWPATRFFRNFTISGIFFAVPSGIVSGPTAAAAAATGGGLMWSLSADRFARWLAERPNNIKLARRMLRLTNPHSDEARKLLYTLMGGAKGGQFVLVNENGEQTKLPTKHMPNGKDKLKNPFEDFEFAPPNIGDLQR